MQSAIVPVQVFPGTANRLHVRVCAFGPPPQLYYELQEVTTIPGTPATEDEPEVPETEAVKCLKNGNVAMTQEQWDDWTKATTDEAYILACAAANLGLTLA